MRRECKRTDTSGTAPRGPVVSRREAGARGVHVRYTLKGDPERRRRHRAAPAPATWARPITGLMTDGGTRFGLLCSRDTWHPYFARLVDFLLDEQRKRNDPDLELHEFEELPAVRTPLPRLPTAMHAWADDDGALDWRRFGFGRESGFGEPVAVVGLEGRSITLHFRDRAFVRLQRRRAPDGTSAWYVTVEAKHKELYARGVYEWCRTWLGYFSWLCLGRWHAVAQQRGAGWTTTAWHLNVDFVGLSWSWEDALDVTAVRKRRLYGRQAADVDNESPGRDDDDDDAPPGWMQTWELGTDSSDIKVVGYKKGEEQRQAKGVDPAATAYAVHWRKHGWDPQREGDPFRVELRARKKGLVYRHVDREEVIFDFRDPLTVCDVEAQRAFWSYVTGRRRFVERTHAKVRTCPTDERWRIVQGAARVEARTDMRQLPHLVAELTRCERVIKDRRKLFDALLDLALDENGVGLEAPADIAAALRELADRVASGEVEVHELGKGILANAWVASKAVRRKAARTEFFAGALVEHQPHYQAELRARGGAGGVSVFELLGPPIHRSDHDERPDLNPYLLPSPDPDGSVVDRGDGARRTVT